MQPRPRAGRRRGVRCSLWQWGRQACAPALTRPFSPPPSPPPQLVVVASLAGFGGALLGPEGLAYCASKAAVRDAALGGSLP